MSRLRKLAENKNNDAFFKKLGELITNRTTLIEVLNAVKTSFRDYKMLMEPEGLDLESPDLAEQEKQLFDEFMDSSDTIIRCLEKLTGEKLMLDVIDTRLDNILNYLKMELLDSL